MDPFLEVFGVGVVADDAKVELEVVEGVVVSSLEEGGEEEPSGVGAVVGDEGGLGEVGGGVDVVPEEEAEGGAGGFDRVEGGEIDGEVACEAGVESEGEANGVGVVAIGGVEEGGVDGVVLPEGPQAGAGGGRFVVDGWNVERRRIGTRGGVGEDGGGEGQEQEAEW